MGHFIKKHQQGFLAIMAFLLLVLIGAYGTLVVRLLLKSFNKAVIAPPPPASVITFDISGAEKILGLPPSR